jgi:hypothetical protein
MTFFGKTSISVKSRLAKWRFGQLFSGQPTFGQHKINQNSDLIRFTPLIRRKPSVAKSLCTIGFLRFHSQTGLIYGFTEKLFHRFFFDRNTI